MGILGRMTIGALAVMAATPAWTVAAPLTSDFTYQGRLRQAGLPVNTNADFRFVLFDAEVGGVQVSSLITRANVPVQGGVFNVPLDFGFDVFDGQERWLVVQVRVPAGAGVYTTLNPRQPLTATPYAMQPRGFFVDGATLNVGMGTTSPSARLDVADGSGDSQVQLDSVGGGGVIRTLALGTVTSDTRTVAGAFTSYNDTSGALLNQLGVASAGNGFFNVRNGNGLSTLVGIGGVGSDGPTLSLRNGSGATRFLMLGEGTLAGAELQMFSAEGVQTIGLLGDDSTGGAFEMFNDLGVQTVSIDGDSVSGAFMSLRNDAGSTRVSLDGDNADGGSILLSAADGSSTVFLDGESNAAGVIEVRNNVSATRVVIDGEETGTLGGFIDVRDETGASAIRLRGEEFAGGGNGAVFEMDAEDGTEVIEIDSGGSAGGAFLYVDGSVSADVKNAVVRTSPNTRHLMYCVEGPELVFEDVGSGQLINGIAEVKIDPLLRSVMTINERYPMRVLVTLTGDCNGVFVIKGTEGFIVKELMNGRSNATFDYKVIAKRAGHELKRMEPFFGPGQEQWPDVDRHVPHEHLGDPTDGAAVRNEPVKRAKIAEQAGPEDAAASGESLDD